MFVIRLLNHPTHRNYWFSSWVNRRQATSLIDNETIYPVASFASEVEAKAIADRIVQVSNCFYENVETVVESI